ncbi:hypothetical protein FKM82_017169 [Ascaphus truei]
MGSRGQVVEEEEEISSDTSSEIAEKESRKAGEELGSIVGWEEATDGMFCRTLATHFIRARLVPRIRVYPGVLRFVTVFCPSALRYFPCRD